MIVIRQSSQVNTLQLPTGQLRIALSKASYSVGQTVAFTMTNSFKSPIYLVNRCPYQPLHVYQYKNSVWTPLNQQINPNKCSSTTHLIAIPAGKSITENYAKWPKLFHQPGIYRLVAFANNYPNLTYVDFQVVSPPSKPIVLPAPTVIYKPVYTPIYIQSRTGSHTDGGGRASHDN